MSFRAIRFVLLSSSGFSPGGNGALPRLRTGQCAFNGPKKRARVGRVLLRPLRILWVDDNPGDVFRTREELKTVAHCVELEAVASGARAMSAPLESLESLFEEEVRVAHSAGNFLLPPDPSRLFADDLEHDYRLADEYPNWARRWKQPGQERFLGSLSAR